MASKEEKLLEIINEWEDRIKDELDEMGSVHTSLRKAYKQLDTQRGTLLQMSIELYGALKEAGRSYEDLLEKIDSLDWRLSKLEGQE